MIKEFQQPEEPKEKLQQLFETSRLIKSVRASSSTSLIRDYEIEVMKRVI